MTSSINTTSIKPQLFLNNGAKSERLQTQEEKSLETEKKQLEDAIFNKLAEELPNQARSHTVSLTDDGETIIIRNQSAAENKEPLRICIKELTTPKPVEKTSIIPSQLEQAVRSIPAPILDALKTNKNLLKEISNWAEKTKTANTEDLAKALQSAWNNALTYIKTSSQVATDNSTATSSEENSKTAQSNIDENSLMINFSKKYVTYKTTDGQLKVIDLFKDTTLAIQMGLDAAIKAIEKEHQIKVLNPSNKACYLDIQQKIKNNSDFNQIKETIKKKIKDSNNVNSLKNFEKALEQKPSKNSTNGVDWFAIDTAIYLNKKNSIDTAINLHKKNSNDATAKIQEAENAIRSLLKDTSKDDQVSAVSDYATDIYLLSLKREEAIKFIEENKSKTRKLLPTESKESLLARAFLHGFDDINDSNFKELFGVELTDNIKELFGVELTDNIKESLTSIPSDATQKKDRTNALREVSGDICLGQNQTPSTVREIQDNTVSAFRNNSSTESISTIEASLPGTRTPGGRASKIGTKPTSIEKLKEAIANKTESRPTPAPTLRSKENDKALRNKITTFVNNIAKNDIKDIDSTSSAPTTPVSATSNPTESTEGPKESHDLLTLDFFRN